MDMCETFQPSEDPLSPPAEHVAGGVIENKHSTDVDSP
jgi:hypothetical protein